MKTRRGFMALILVVTLLASLFGTASVALAQTVDTQVGFAVDGSGSISSGEFGTMIEGLASAIEDPTVVPQDGTVEVCVVQFADDGVNPQADVEVPATVIDSQATADTVAATIRAMVQKTGLTPTGAGISLVTAEMTGSPNWATATRHIINLCTNGHPEPDPPEGQNAIDARDAAIAAGITEIDAECIGVTDFWFNWTKDNLCYPQPAVEAPPFPDPAGSVGFAVRVDSFDDFPAAIEAKLKAIIIPPQVPGVTGWGIMVAAIILAVLMPLALRRRELSRMA
jgi:hypothetical protein